VPQGPNDQILTDLSKIQDLSVPLIVHPELATAENMNLSTPFREIEVEKRVFSCKIIINDERNILASEFRLNSDEEAEEEDGELENSESCSEDYYPDIMIGTFDGGEKAEQEEKASEVNSMFLNVPSNDRKRVSLPTVSNSDDSLKANSPRHRSFQVLGLNSRPVPIQDVPFMKKGFHVEQAYHEHISKFPEDWETAAVKKIFKALPRCPIHFSNVSSAEAIKAISEEKLKNKVKVTCETSLPYIYFSESDVKPGDTRYKLNPPIRPHKNFTALWQMIRNKEIDCISSYHQPVAPPCKFIGDFTRAVNGVISAGFLLQAVWTKLRPQVPLEDEGVFLAFMTDLLCKNPAEVMGLKSRGVIAKGKFADLVVWDPDSRVKVQKTFDRFPEMSPMIGEEVYGVVHRTYLRGEPVFVNGQFLAKGKVLCKEDEIRG
jgi:dihydroorotase-like cyclic amidohydrolase